MNIRKVFLVFVPIIALLASGIPLILISLFPADQYTELHKWARPIQGIHLYVWMVLGVFSNYLWTEYTSGSPFSDMDYRKMAMPLVISPMLFYPVYALVDETKITFLLNLTSFQNGFFWQTLFSRIKPAAQGE